MNASNIKEIDYDECWKNCIATIFDAMDTMLIMGLDDLYNTALDFVLKTDFTKTKSGPAKGFETCIRYLGGLLSANDLRPNPALVDKAVELADNVLLPLFSSPSGAPYTYMNVGTYVYTKINLRFQAADIYI